MRGLALLGVLIGGGYWLARRAERTRQETERDLDYRAQLERERIRSDWEPQVDGLSAVNVTRTG